jgi:hypothetical protein
MSLEVPAAPRPVALDHDRAARTAPAVSCRGGSSNHLPISRSSTPSRIPKKLIVRDPVLRAPWVAIARIARPCPLLGAFDKARTHGVEMNVAANGPVVALVLDHHKTKQRLTPRK